MCSLIKTIFNYIEVVETVIILVECGRVVRYIDVLNFPLNKTPPV